MADQQDKGEGVSVSSEGKRRGRSEGGPRNDPKAIDEVTAFLNGTLERMGLDCDVERFDEDDDVVLEIRGEDAATAIGKKGATLDALQLLANRVARKATGPTGFTSILLDADGYRARREQSLTEMAQRLGEQARRDGQVVSLDPNLSPRDRRVVHMALAEFPGVATRSVGEGFERRLQIVPAPERRG